jgi:hypothetical protein
MLVTMYCYQVNSITATDAGNMTRLLALPFSQLLQAMPFVYSKWRELSLHEVNQPFISQ